MCDIEPTGCQNPGSFGEQRCPSRPHSPEATMIPTATTGCRTREIGRALRHFAIRSANARQVGNASGAA